MNTADDKHTPTCDMVQGCTEPVTMIDRSGYAYCTRHGRQRRMCQPCRKLRPAERETLQRGEALAHY